MSAFAHCRLRPAVTRTCPTSRTGLWWGVAAAGPDVWAVGQTETFDVRLAARRSSGTWTVATPGATPDHNLYCVGATDSSHVWAGGYQAGSTTVNTICLWNGSSWSAVDSPTPGGAGGWYFVNPHALAVGSTSDVWVGGNVRVSGGGSLTAAYIRHWNGTAWGWVALPQGPNTIHALWALSATPGGSIWCAGRGNIVVSGVGRFGQYLGRISSSSAVEYDQIHFGQLYGCYAADDTHLFGVGYRTTTGTSGDDTRDVVRYTGSAWVNDTLPALPGAAAYSYLQAVHGVSASDVWAVGFWLDSSDSQEGPLLYHWDGSSWTDYSAAAALTYSGPGQYIELYGVAACASNDVYVGGAVWCADGSNHNLVLHWDGSTWTEVSVP